MAVSLLNYYEILKLLKNVMNYLNKKQKKQSPPQLHLPICTATLQFNNCLLVSAVSYVAQLSHLIQTSLIHISFVN